MRIVVTTPPQPLVELDEMKVVLGESGNERDLLIQGLIMAGQSYLDGPKSITGFTVAEQSVDVYFDNFDTDIYLPGVTIIDPISNVQYLDADGALQVLTSDYYALQSDGRLALVSGQTWPTVSTTGDGVIATYDLGITEDGDPRIEQMRTAIMMHVKMTLDMADPELYQRVITALVAPLWVAKV
jgi:hypothetical protein